MTAQVKAVAIKKEGRRRMVLPPEQAVSVDDVYDLRRREWSGLIDEVGTRASLIGDALEVFFSGGNRIIRVLGDNGTNPDVFIEIVLPEAPLRETFEACASGDA